MSLRRLWHGDIPLETAFWSYAVVGGIAVNVATSLAFLILVTLDLPVVALIAGYAPSLPYNFLASVGVWRAAEHEEFATEKAKLYPIITVVGMILLSVT